MIHCVIIILKPPPTSFDVKAFQIDTIIVEYSTIFIMFSYVGADYEGDFADEEDRIVTILK